MLPYKHELCSVMMTLNIPIISFVYYDLSSYHHISLTLLSFYCSKELRLFPVTCFSALCHRLSFLHHRLFSSRSFFPPIYYRLFVIHQKVMFCRPLSPINFLSLTNLMFSINLLSSTDLLSFTDSSLTDPLPLSNLSPLPFTNSSSLSTHCLYRLIPSTDSPSL